MRSPLGAIVGTRKGCPYGVARAIVRAVCDGLAQEVCCGLCSVCGFVQPLQFNRSGANARALQQLAHRLRDASGGQPPSTEMYCATCFRSSLQDGRPELIRPRTQPCVEERAGAQKRHQRHKGQLRDPHRQIRGQRESGEHRPSVRFLVEIKLGADPAIHLVNGEWSSERFHTVDMPQGVDLRSDVLWLQEVGGEA